MVTCCPSRSDPRQPRVIDAAVRASHQRLAALRIRCGKSRPTPTRRRDHQAADPLPAAVSRSYGALFAQLTDKPLLVTIHTRPRGGEPSADPDEYAAHLHPAGYGRRSTTTGHQVARLRSYACPLLGCQPRRTAARTSHFDLTPAPTMIPDASFRHVRRGPV